MTYVAGVAAFIAPCTLVLVPFFALFLLGTLMTDAAQRRGTAALSTARWLAVGFVVVFVLAWAFPYPEPAIAVLRWLRGLERFGGLLLIVYGLWLTGLLAALRGDLRGVRDPRVAVPLALLIGGTLAAGWTPCVGSALSHILGMAGGPDGVWAAVLLAVYGLGLMTPFIVLGWAAGRIRGRLGRADVRRWASPALGIGLVVVGIVVFTGNLRDLTAYMFALWPGLAI
jgi:cytochrome c-type biogenesis protein